MNGPRPCRFRICEAEETSMDQRTVRKIFKHTLQLTAEQDGTMSFVVRRCCELYTAGL